MKSWWLIGVFFFGLAPGGVRAEDFLDRVDQALSLSAFQDQLRLRFSGTIDLEIYHFKQPAPGLIDSNIDTVFNPRLTLFLDAQWQSQIYVFVQGGVDRGFDPSNHGAQPRLDAYAVRYTPWEDGRVTFQIGKFATVAGTFAQRHLSWDNPFVSAPLLYENVTPVSDKSAPSSTAAFLHRFEPGDKYEFSPIIWGPSYASGLSIAGRLDKFDYAIEIKNAPLSSRPESWSLTEVGLQNPTVTARLGFRPNPMWNFGVSASDGAYFREEARMNLPAGRDLGDYHERVLGQDITFAWHHLQIWAECYEVQFDVPRVGNAGTVGYYFEAKYRFAPQLFGAVRWNEQLFGTVRSGGGSRSQWGADLSRIDLSLAYRLTAHSQVKLQYSYQTETSGPGDTNHLLAAQFTVRF